MVNWVKRKGVHQMKKEDSLAAITVPKSGPTYDEIEVALEPPRDDSPLSSPETPVKHGDGEDSMDEDPPPLNEDNSPF